MELFFNFGLSRVLIWIWVTLVELSLSSRVYVPELDPEFISARNELENLCSTHYLEAPFAESCPTVCRDKFPYNFYTEKTGFIWYSEIIMGQTATHSPIGDRGKLCECGLKSGGKVCQRPYRIVRKKFVPKSKKPECNNAFDDVAVFVQRTWKESGKYRENIPAWCHHGPAGTIREFQTVPLQSLVTSKLKNGKFKCWCGVTTETLRRHQSNVHIPDTRDIHELPPIGLSPNNATGLTSSQISSTNQFPQFGQPSGRTAMHSAVNLPPTNHPPPVRNHKSGEGSSSSAGGSRTRSSESQQPEFFNFL